MATMVLCGGTGNCEEGGGGHFGMGVVLGPVIAGGWGQGCMGSGGAPPPPPSLGRLAYAQRLAS